MKLRMLAPALLAAGLLIACRDNTPPAPTTPTAGNTGSGAQTALGRTVEKAMAEARTALEKENLELNGKEGGLHIGKHGIGSHDPNLPSAEITPSGDFILDGKTLAINDVQRAQVLDYRRRVLDVAGAGMSVGVKGADLGMQAAGEAMKGIFSGNMDQVEQRIQTEAKKLEADAKLICQQLTPLLQAQDALTAGLPEFKPYAGLEQADIDDCLKDGGTAVFTGNKRSATSQAQVQSEIRDGIRQSVRSAVQQATAAAGVAGAAATGGASNVSTVNGVRVLLPAGSIDTTTINGDTTIKVSNGLRVKLDGSGLEVNGERYPAPAHGSEVDLRESGTVRIDGKVVAARS